MAKKPRPPSAPRRPRPAGNPLRVVFEDDDVLVADKPAGIPTTLPPTARSARDTLFDLVKRHVRRPAGHPARVYVVHRLDAEVSGLVAFAKTERAFQWLKEDLRSRRVRRVYLALVEGAPPADDTPGAASTIQSLILESTSGPVRVLAPGERPRHRPQHTHDRPLTDDEPRHAITHYQTIARGPSHSLVRVRLESGRKHQIRAHLAWIGHPVAGDTMYGARTDPARRVALHAAELTFTHPGTGAAVRLESPAPAVFWRAAGREPPAAQQPPEPARSAPRAQPRTPERARSSWDNVAEWYDDLVDERRNDLHHDVVIPGAMRLLQPRHGQRILDLACGQGVLCRELAANGALTWGLDASPRLIDLARQRSPRGPRFEVADARALHQAPAGFFPPERFDAVACVMALMNMEPLSSVIEGVAAVLRPGGHFVAVILHPAFRSPGRTSWGWEQTDGHAVQYRRIDSYLSPGERDIVMNPGDAARGRRPVTTQTYHRPLQTYTRHLAEHGLLIDALEEWPSHRTSEPGPRAEAENRARREIPMFLGLRAVLAPGANP